METVTRVLGTSHETGLKGRNRGWFEHQLNENVTRALSDLPLERVSRPSNRILATFSEPVPFEEAARRMATVSGVKTVMPAEWIGHELEDVERALPGHLEGLTPASFAVRCARPFKRYPLTSTEIERRLGGLVVQRTGWPVDLDDPALTIGVLCERDGFSLFLHRFAGPGGLPVGTAGRGTCLLSGGIDSPVAAWLMMKRGMRLDFVHFHSVPRTDPASLEKVEELVRWTVRFQGTSHLAMVPLLDIQERIAADCPADLRVLLYRRFMLRLSERFAREWGGRGLVTGESLSQVASQTIENLAAVSAVATMPVLRPLVGLDKQDAVDIARRTGSFEISIRPHFDCCSYLMPDHPATRSSARRLERAERELDVEALERSARERSETIRVRDPLPWSVYPVPPRL